MFKDGTAKKHIQTIADVERIINNPVLNKKSLMKMNVVNGVDMHVMEYSYKQLH